MKNPLSALFISNEAMITGALLALRERNINIPEQIAIVGFDDPAWGPLLDPPLSAVSQPAYSMGTMACQTLLQKINEPGRERTSFEELVLKPKLIVRGSCGKKIDKVAQPTEATLSIIAVPTTAGTGSEATFYAVLTNSKIKEKSAIINPLVFPRLRGIC